MRIDLKSDAERFAPVSSTKPNQKVFKTKSKTESKQTSKGEHSEYFNETS